MSYENVARGRRAWQSSVSPWSKQPTIEDDAMGATSGDPTKDYGFHTNFEANPWWMVDLEECYIINEIRVYNRTGMPALQARASPILIETSVDNEAWSEFFRSEPGFTFGGDERQNKPLVRSAPIVTRGRFVRITVPGDNTCLHLAEVEVYGDPCAPHASEAGASSEDGTTKPEPSAKAPSSTKQPKRSGWLSFLGF